MKMALVALAALLLTPVALAADTTDFTEASYLRVAYGDIPRTSATEPANRWNAVEYQRITDRGATSWAPGLFELPSGFQFDGADCTCGNVTVDIHPDGRYQIDYPAGVPAGEYVMAFRSHRDVGDFAFTFEPQVVPSVATFYLTADQSIQSNLAPTVAGLTSTAENPGYSIWSYATSASDHGFSGTWFVVGSNLVAPATASGPNYVLLAAAAIAGALVWAILVSRGLVQKKSRKQVATVAAHVEAAQTDPAPVLEGKKRALLAALKDVELARQGNEMTVEVYDVVKADLKKQAVTVMRALEQGK
ncbi:MAG: hypothetical protein AABX89_01070 [Candidatus Thermoplasmatota archaeon]